MRQLKKIGAVLLAILMLCGSFGFGIGLFCLEISQKETIAQALDTIDMAQLVETEMGDRYALIGKLMDTAEFKDILSTYTDGLVNYIVNGEGEVNVDKEQVRALFTNYSEVLLNDYPEFAFLPTSKLIDFLVDSIDFNTLLPSYDEVSEKVPVDVINTVQVMRSPLIVAGSLAVFLFSSIGLLCLSHHHAFWWMGIVLIISGCSYLCAAYSTDWLFALEKLADYQMFKEAGRVCLGKFFPLAKYYLLSGLVIELIYGMFCMGRKRNA